MKPLYSFEFTPTGYNQTKPISIEKCNDIVLGDLFFSHSSFLADILALFTKYQFMELSFKPHIGICLGSNCIGKFDPTDRETNLEGLITFLKLLEIPNCGVDVTFYEMSTTKSQSSVEINQRNFQHMWSFRESWTGSGDYILISKYRNKPWLPKEDMSFVQRVADDLNLEIKEFRYGQSVLEQYHLVKNCKVMVSQRGNAVYFAALMRAPLVLLGGGLYADVVVPIGDDKIGSIICQNSIIGMDPDTSWLENGKLINKPYDQAVMTYSSCDNSTLLKDIISGTDVPTAFRKNIKNNKEQYTEFYKRATQYIEEVA